jgi:iron(III) transport system ATP-binding protein
MTSPSPAVVCEHLCKRFGEAVAVEKASIQVQPGTFLSLLGPSGCGKTTMLRLIAGFEHPDQGRIQIEGRWVSDDHTCLRPDERRIGMIFQEYALFPHLTVADNIAYGLGKAKNGEREKRVRDVLRLVGLEGMGHRMPEVLSGGQQQRVAIARALAPKPGVILMDEPFSNLDASLRSRVRNEIRNILKEAGVTVILVTHDQEEALSLSDEVAVMMDGEILQRDQPETLYQLPATHQVATFLGDANFLPVNEVLPAGVRCELGVVSTLNEVQEPHEIMFRPEQVELVPNELGAAKVTDIEFFGHDQLVHLETNKGSILRGRVFGCHPVYRKGQRVQVKISGDTVAYSTPFGCPI